MLKLTLKEAGAAESDPFTFMDFDFSKLSMPLKFQIISINKAFINRAIAKDKLKILRMKGAIQSYDFNDSQFYRQAKKIMKEINE